jgi:hypothetical protein
VTAARSNESEGAVAALIETYRQGFLRLDPELLGAIWDREHDPLVYVAMERPEPIYGWPGIKRYYEALPAHLEQMLAKSVDDARIDLLGDTAVAFFQFHSKVKIRASAAPTEVARPAFRRAGPPAVNPAGEGISTLQPARWRPQKCDESNLSEVELSERCSSQPIVSVATVLVDLLIPWSLN